MSIPFSFRPNSSAAAWCQPRPAQTLCDLRPKFPGRWQTACV